MKRHLSIVLTGDFAARGLLALAGFVLIRDMEIHEFAVYVVLAGFSSMVAGALTGAFGTLYIVSHAELKLERRISEFFCLQLFFAVSVAVLALPFENLFSGHGGLMTALVLSSVTADFARDVERQKLNFSKFTLYSLIKNGVFLILVVALGWVARPQLTAFNVTLLQILACVLASFPILRSIKSKVNIAALREIMFVLWSQQLLFFLYVLLVAIFSQVDIVFLKIWSNDYQIGSFGSAFRYYAIAIAALGSINSVLLPKLPTVSSKQEMRTLMKSVSRIILFALPFVGVLALIAPWAMPLVDKGKFPESIATFQILCASAAVSLVLSPYGNILLVHKKYQVLFYGIAFGLVLKGLLNFMLVPRFGSLGAAIAILAVSVILHLFFFSVAQRSMVET